MRFGKKLHYTLKYLVLGLPIILLILTYLSKDSTIFDSFQTSLFDFSCQMLEFTNSTWFTNILDILGVSYQDFDYLGYILCCYPLYVFYVYLFDLVVDVITFIPKFFHELLNKDYLK